MRIFIDENLSEYVADALNYLDRGYFPNVEVVSTKREIRVGARDEEIFPVVGQEEGVLITRDYNIKRKKAQAGLYRQYSIGMVFIRLPKDGNTHWQMVKLLIAHWQDIIEICTKKKPFAYRLSVQTGLKPI